MVPYLSADCIMMFPLGLKLSSKSERSVKEILHSPAFVPWKSFDLSKVDVTPIGREAAVISYLATAMRPPAPAPGRAEGEDESVTCPRMFTEYLHLLCDVV